MAVTSSSLFFLFWVVQGIGSYSCLSPAEETVAALNLHFIWAQTTFTLEQKDKITGCLKIMSRETVQCTSYWPSWRCCYGVMWDCVSHSVSENVHSQKGFWNKHHVSISSCLCFSKMGLSQFLLTLNLLFLGILNWIFRRCSGEMVVSSWSVVLFLECLKFSSLLATAVWYPYEASQFILNSSRTGSVAVQWEGRCTLAKFSLEVLASETSWNTEIFNMIAVCCKS